MLDWTVYGTNFTDAKRLFVAAGHCASQININSELPYALVTPTIYSNNSEEVLTMLIMSINLDSFPLRFLLSILLSTLLSACDFAQNSNDLIEIADEMRRKGAVADALNYYRLAAKSSPEDATIRRALAETYLIGGDGVSAEKEIRKAAELGQSTINDVVTLGESLLLQGRTTDILENMHVSELSVQNNAHSGSGQAELELARIEADALLLSGRFEDATDAFGALLSSDPDNVASLVGLGVIAFARGDLEEARSKFDEAIKLDSSYALLWRNVGNLERAEGNMEKAEQAYSKAIELHYNNADDIFFRFLTRLDLNKLTEASKDLALFKSRNSRKYLNYYAKGQLHFRKNEFQLAADEFRLALKANPDFLPAITYTAFSDILLGKFEQAEANLKTVLRQNPNSVPLLKALGEVYVKLKDSARAHETFEKILELEPNNQFARQMLSMTALQSGDREKAIKLLRDMASKSPEDSTVKLNLGLNLLENGQFEAGIAALRSAQKAKPADGLSYGVIAFSYLSEGEIEKARETAELAIEKIPTSLGFNILAGIALQLGDMESAKRTFEEAHERFPSDISVAHNLAAIDIALGDLKAASDRYQSILVSRPSDMRANLKLAELALREGDFRAARDYADKAHSLNAESEAALLLLAGLDQQQGDIDSARIRLQSLLDLSPGHEAATVAFASILIDEGDYRAANSLLLTASNLKPNAPEINYLLGKTYRYLGNPEGATKAWRKTLGAPVRSTNTHIDAIRGLIEIGSLDTATKALDAFKKQHGGSLEGKWLQALLEAARKNYVGAIPILEGILEETPNHRESVLLLARAAGRSGDFGKSEEILSEWVKHQAMDTQAYFQLGNTQMNLGKNKEAIATYKKVISLQDDHVLALNNLAMLTVESGDLDYALELSERAVQLRPEAAYTLDTLGTVQNALGKHEEAASTLTRAVRFAPENTMIKLNLSRVYLTLGDAKAARSLLVEIVNSEAESPVGEEARSLLKKLK